MGIFVLFLKKKTKNGFEKTGGLFFWKNWIFSTLIISFNPFLQFSLDHTIWNKSHHYQFDWLRAAHLEYRSLVMKKLRITGIWIR